MGFFQIIRNKHVKEYGEWTQHRSAYGKIRREWKRICHRVTHPLRNVSRFRRYNVTLVAKMDAFCELLFIAQPILKVIFVHDICQPAEGILRALHGPFSF
jgi:hypothetical protein